MSDGKRLFAALLASVILLLPPAAAGAALSKDQVAAQVEKEFGVKVLGVRPGTADGRAVFIVKVMFLGGNFNTAFQVHSWEIDPESGRRILQFRHLPSGHELSGGYQSRPNQQAPEALRRYVWH